MPASRVHYWQPSRDVTAFARFENARQLLPGVSTARPSWDQSRARAGIPLVPRLPRVTGGAGAPPVRAGAPPAGREGRSAVRLPKLGHPVQSVAEFVDDPNGEASLKQLHAQMRAMAEEHERQMKELHAGMQHELMALRNAFSLSAQPSRVPPLSGDASGALAQAHAALSLKEAENEALRRRLSYFEREAEMAEEERAAAAGSAALSAGIQHDQVVMLQAHARGRAARVGAASGARAQHRMLPEAPMNQAHQAHQAKQAWEAAAHEAEEAAAASRMQAHARGRRVRAEHRFERRTERPYHAEPAEAIAAPSGNLGARRKATLAGIDLLEGIDDGPIEDLADWSAEVAAATCMQAVHRGHSERQRRQKERERLAREKHSLRARSSQRGDEDDEQAHVAAATRVQAIHRGHSQRQRLATQRGPPMASFDGYSQQSASFDDFNEQAHVAAATRVQAIHRGHSQRQRLATQRVPPMASFDDHDEDEPFDSPMDEPTVYEYDAEAAAATKLQAIQRGHTGRAKVAAKRADANASRLTPPDAFA